jgi:hypothetical protein
LGKIELTIMNKETTEEEKILYSYILNKEDWVHEDEIQEELGFSLKSIIRFQEQSEGQIILKHCQLNMITLKATVNATEDEVSTALKNVVSVIKKLYKERDGLIVARQNKRGINDEKKRTFVIKNSKKHQKHKKSLS